MSFEQPEQFKIENFRQEVDSALKKYAESVAFLYDNLDIEFVPEKSKKEFEAIEESEMERIIAISINALKKSASKTVVLDSIHTAINEVNIKTIHTNESQETFSETYLLRKIIERS